MTRSFKDGLTAMPVEDWVEAAPEHLAQRHRALVDTQALRMAWLVATERRAPRAQAKSAHRLRAAK